MEVQITGKCSPCTEGHDLALTCSLTRKELEELDPTYQWGFTATGEITTKFVGYNKTYRKYDLSLEDAGTVPYLTNFL